MSSTSLNTVYPIENNCVKYKNVLVPLPREFAHVLRDFPVEAYDYDNFEVDWKSPDNVELVKEIGRGKYSKVFLAVEPRCPIESAQRYVVKVLLPVKDRKIKREICILKQLRNGPNIIELYRTNLDPVSETPSLVMEYVENCEFKQLIKTFTNRDAKKYLFQLLVALHYSNSMGVMHRDVKPLNIVFNPATEKLRLIDWGLAEFYHPGEVYNVRVASRFYKAPELLTGFVTYDYNVDMWSVGCMLASLCFRKEPFFKSEDNDGQLRAIIQVLGYKRYAAYVRRYNLDPSVTLEDRKIVNCKAVPLSSFITKANEAFVSPEALDLLERLFRFDFVERITAQQAMDHPYFDEVRDEICDLMKRNYGDKFSYKHIPWTSHTLPVFN